MQRVFTVLMTYWVDPDIKIGQMLGNEKHRIVLMKFAATSKNTGSRDD